MPSTLRIGFCVPLKLSDDSHERSLGPDADVVKSPELSIGHPTQVAKAVITGANQRFQHYGLEMDVMRGQVRRIVKSDVHPSRPIWAPRTGEFTVPLFLPCEKADFVGFLCHCQ